MNTTMKQRLEVLSRLKDAGFDYQTANNLRRISLTLQHWAEKECGGGSDWAIERDEETGKPFLAYHGPNERLLTCPPRRYPIADRERGALKRLGKIMAAHPDFVAYHQTDPRGCALYIVSVKDLADGSKLDQVYNRGIAVY